MGWSCDPKSQRSSSVNEAQTWEKQHSCSCLVSNKEWVMCLCTSEKLDVRFKRPSFSSSLVFCSRMFSDGPPPLDLSATFHTNYFPYLSALLTLIPATQHRRSSAANSIVRLQPPANWRNQNSEFRGSVLPPLFFSPPLFFPFSLSSVT